MYKYLINCEQVKITINGTPFNICKEFIEDKLIVGAKEFSDRYSFTLEDMKTSPEEFMPEVIDMLAFYSRDTYSEDCIRFVDKYYKDVKMESELNDHKMKIFRSKMDASLNNNGIPDSLKVLHAEISEEEQTKKIIADIQDTYNLLYYLTYTISYIPEYGGVKDVRNEYLLYTLFRASPSVYAKYMSGKEKTLKEYMTTELFNNLMNIIAEDLSITFMELAHKIWNIHDTLSNTVTSRKYEDFTAFRQKYDRVKK